MDTANTLSEAITELVDKIKLWLKYGTSVERCIEDSLYFAENYEKDGNRPLKGWLDREKATNTVRNC
jgi:hypothetical protein